ncbi:MAG: CHAP domain-containing protein, partial [bacterium]|nr:CHAP domain-containing protein [bacterium]
MKETNKKMAPKIYHKILLILASIVLLTPSVAMAVSFEEQVQQLNNEIEQNNNSVKKKAGEADTLQNKLAILAGQINSAQAALNKTKVEITQSQARLKKIEEDLNHNKDLLKENVRLIYKKGETSELEILASSDNLSDFVERQQSMQNIKDKINSILNKMEADKRDQDNENTRLVNLGSQQQNQTNDLNSQKANQQGLLAQTKGEESKYQGIVAQKKKDLAAVYAAHEAADKVAGTPPIIGGTGGYPFANWPIDVSDGLGYLTRECTSYAAWWRQAHGRPVGSSYGNAGNWPGSYIAPAYGDVAVFGPGVGGAFGVGHVAIVESVNGNGTINLS